MSRPGFSTGTAAILLLLAAGSGRATTWNVTVSNFAFTPGALTIAVGDSVKWTNVAPLTPHTATDNGAAWDTGTLSPSGGTKTLGFVAAGFYQYHCVFHALSMTATLDVQVPVSVEDGEPVSPAATWGRVKKLYGAR